MSDLELTMMRRVGELNKENARLKAEVEGLMIFCNCTLIPSKELQAKVERLTKAGDILAFHYTALGRKVYGNDPLPPSIIEWLEARNNP
jgi:hypothetical protein